MRLRPQEVTKKPTRKAQGQKAMTPDDIVFGCAAQRPLLGVKRTWRGLVGMSANDPKRTFQREAHGKGVVEKVRTERPQDYLKIVASVMPKRMEVEDVDPPRRAAD